MSYPLFKTITYENDGYLKYTHWESKNKCLIISIFKGIYNTLNGSN